MNRQLEIVFKAGNCVLLVAGILGHAGGCLVSENSAPPAVTKGAASKTSSVTSQAAPVLEEAPRGVAPSVDLLGGQATELPELPAETPRSNETPNNSFTAAPEPGAKPREALFVDWPKPLAALLVSGMQAGYLEPCGCTGLANQKGGLARRHTLLKQLVGKGWPLVPLDVGNQVRRFGRQPEIQFQMTFEAFQKMGYRGVGFGPDDLQISTGELVAAAAAGGDESLMVCSNIFVLDAGLTRQFRIIDAGGKKIGVTGVLSDEFAKRVLNDEITKLPALEGLAAVWPKLKAEKCDVYVLLAHASLADSRAYAEKLPEFDIVVTAGGAGEPTLEPEKIPGAKSVLVQVGTKGMYVGVLGFYEGPGPKLRYQRVPLDDRFADSQDMLTLLASYQEQLKSAGLEGLGVKPLPHPSGRTFVGSETCGDCHSTAYEIWQKTPHAAATESLVHPGERSEIARHFDPECLSCHVTGWNAQKYYPYKSGYLSLADKAMHGSGCENCHGPGSRHVAAESGGDASPEVLKMLRASMRLPLAEAEKRCIDCHDLDNSPDFHQKGAFEKYWKKIEHKGLD